MSEKAQKNISTTKHNGEPLVSICSMTYNHEPFIRQCLDGFLMQETDFPFEVLIHDDASTDKTADIIKEYVKKYPDIIKPIFQTENQYSQGVKIGPTYVYPKAKGKYIALCEGDDYWIDPYKLQKQVQFLEENYEYILSAGRSKVYVGNSFREFPMPKTGTITFKDIAHKNFIVTNTTLFRNIFKGNKVKKFYHYINEVMNGDIYLWLFLLKEGKGYVHDDIFGVYRRHEAGVWSLRPVEEKCLRSLKTRNVILKYLRDVKADSSYINDVEVGYLKILNEYLKDNKITNEIKKTVPKSILRKTINANQKTSILRISLDKNIILFGTGELARSITKNLQKANVRVAYYLDNNPQKQGLLFFNRPVYNPNVLYNTKRTDLFIIIASMYYEEIAQQLETMGFRKSKHYLDHSELSY